ncbi:hypothetical protein AVEN_214706-1 [Araneus ventricosus]|uniref:Uncharacterized protein n=1 Tax=Araneus ventricosus TaxID=182803 RepID=A0A4Y2LJ80_ARAVE|nr:hypothetical protein AVEN_214706-1 [Araneus ventricosus]
MKLCITDANINYRSVPKFRFNRLKKRRSNCILNFLKSDSPFVHPVSSFLLGSGRCESHAFHLLSLSKGIPLMTTRPTAFSPHSEQQPDEIRPTSIEVVWPVTAGLGVRGLMVIKELYPVPPGILVLNEVATTAQILRSEF